MTDRVLIVTPPDDVPLKDGIRILCVDLTSEQTQIVSDSLNLLEAYETVITYIWKTSHSTDWLLDKKQKSQLILFNADSNYDLIVGYIAAQSNSHYFGTLRSLRGANDCTLYDKDQLVNILEQTIKRHKTK